MRYLYTILVVSGVSFLAFLLLSDGQLLLGNVSVSSQGVREALSRAFTRDTTDDDPTSAVNQEAGGVFDMDFVTGSNFYLSIYDDVAGAPEKLLAHLRETLQLDADEASAEAPIRYEGIELEAHDGVVGLSSLLFDLTDAIFSAEKSVPRGEINTEALTSDDCSLVQLAEERKRAQEYGILRGRIEQKSDDVYGGQAPAEYFLEMEKALLGDMSFLGSLSSRKACEERVRDITAFQAELDTVFGPLQAELEILQTFSNGRLNDFDDSNRFQKALDTPGIIPQFSALSDWGLPKYDLLFDVQVMERLLFGSALNVFDGRKSGSASATGPFATSTAPSKPSVIASHPSKLLSASILSDSSLSSDSSQLSLTLSSLGGSGGSCPYLQGVQLDFSPFESFPDVQATVRIPPPVSLDRLSVRAEPRLPDAALDATLPSDVPDVPSGLSGLSSQLGRLLGTPGGFEEFDGFVSSLQADGEASDCMLGQEGDFLQYLVCLRVDLEKRGKGSEKRRDELPAPKGSPEEVCVACQIRKLNELIEDELLTQSIRPHKNAGKIMESGLCKDAYSDDLGFHINVELVPVRFYDPICYPNAGMYEGAYALLEGQPSILEAVSSGSTFDCKSLIDEPEAQKRCIATLGASGSIDSEAFAREYRRRSEVWEQIVGAQGIAERRLHELQVRLGEKDPQFGEADDGASLVVINARGKNEPWYNIFQPRRDTPLWQSSRYAQRKQELLRLVAQKTEEFRRTLKGELLDDIRCLQGGALVSSSSCANRDSLKKLEEDIQAERDAVNIILGEWNSQKEGFERKHSCGAFEREGIFRPFGDFFANRLFSPDFYYIPEDEAADDPVDRKTSFILDKTEPSSLDEFFGTFQEELKQDKEREHILLLQQQQQKIAEVRNKASSELLGELRAFSQYIEAFNQQLRQLTDDKKLRSKNGKSMLSILEKFKEKVGL